MLLSLGAAGLAAIAVFTTAAVVILQRDENARTQHEFDAYKLETAKQISEANAAGDAAKADAAKARSEIAESTKQAEQAKASAADANRKAELERLERLRLEATVAPRSIGVAQQQMLAAAWAVLGRQASVHHLVFVRW